jgi:diketogulonate reductase-like aldo/keto reductase
MEEAVDSGVVKSIGISNFKPNHIEDLMSKARIKPVIN